jgi:hypothetical protein
MKDTNKWFLLSCDTYIFYHWFLLLCINVDICLGRMNHPQDLIKSNIEEIYFHIKLYYNKTSI